MTAKVSDIQSSPQKPQQFKPIFLNTALTASEISEFSHKHLRTEKQKEQTKRRLHLSAAFSELYKRGDSNPSQCRASWGHMVSIIRLGYDALESEDFHSNLLMPETGLDKRHPLRISASSSVKWGWVICTWQAAQQVQWGTRSDSWVPVAPGWHCRAPGTSLSSPRKCHWQWTAWVHLGRSGVNPKHMFALNFTRQTNYFSLLFTFH